MALQSIMEPLDRVEGVPLTKVRYTACIGF